MLRLREVVIYIVQALILDVSMTAGGPIFRRCEEVMRAFYHHLDIRVWYRFYQNTKK